MAAFNITKTTEIVRYIRGNDESDQQTIERDYESWCSAADTMMFMHESLSADEAMAIAIAYYHPKWTTKPPAETEIIALGSAPLGIYAREMIKKLGRSHPTLTFEEWFIIAKLQFGEKNLC